MYILVGVCIIIILLIIINYYNKENYDNIKLNKLRGTNGAFYVNCKNCNDNKYISANDNDLCSYSPNRLVSKYCDEKPNKLMYFYDKDYKLVPQSVCVNGLLEEDYYRSLDEFLTNSPSCY